ncbi:MAG: hypothetical protein KGJ07_09720, partial [Patescibacteria group bacterium]|nr:hypothetical protein [Patescibacteria group bacterium]
MESDTLQKEHASPLESALLKLLVIVFCGAIVGIICVTIFRLFSSSSQPTSLLTPLSQETPTPIPTHAVSTTFQQTLSRACSPAKNSDKNLYTLSF